MKLVSDLSDAELGYIDLHLLGGHVSLDSRWENSSIPVRDGVNLSGQGPPRFAVAAHGVHDEEAVPRMRSLYA